LLLIIREEVLVVQLIIGVEMGSGVPKRMDGQNREKNSLRSLSSIVSGCMDENTHKRIGSEVGKDTLNINGDEAISDESLLKSNGDEALNDDFP
jgi:hypothetical protein